MAPALTPATHRASVAIGGEEAAKRVVDVLTETFSEGQFLEHPAAIAAFERPDGRWGVTAHFAAAPDQALVRDIDPLSVKVARENAQLNKTGNLVQVIRARGFSAPQFATQGPFDLVLANILANPLRQLARPMAGHLAPSALVILSGLLNHQASGVIAAYRARGLVPVRHLAIEGWSSLLLRRAK